MISLSNILLTELMSDEQYNKNILKTTRNKPIADAIKNRKKITFYYTGPRSPKKDNVKAGYRVKVEPVAMGLNKKGKLVLRAWVEPPSVSKKGFKKTNWRTFILSRTNNIQITDETFDIKRPGYNEDGDKSMSIVYAKSDWGKQVKPKKEVKPKPTPTKAKTKAPEKEPEVKPTELPTPSPETKPTTQPSAEVPSIEKPSVEPKLPQVPSQEKPSAEPVGSIDQNLPQPKPEEKPPVNPEDEGNEEDENNQLNESIIKIKRLMFY